MAVSKEEPTKEKAEGSAVKGDQPTAKDSAPAKPNGRENGSTVITNEQRASASLSYLAIVGCFAVALISFSAGVLTPPFFLSSQGAHQLESRKLVKDPNRELATAAAEPHPYASCDEQALSEFLHEDAVPGMHVMCIKKDEGDSDKLALDIFKGAQMGTPLSAGASEITWASAKDSLTNALQLRGSDDLHQPWAIFSPLGERIVGEQDEGVDNPEESLLVIKRLLDSGMILIMEGGQWLWPGVRVGFERSVDLYSIMPGLSQNETYPTEKRTTTLKTLSLKPLVLAVEDFLSEEECNHIQEKATPSMKYSGVVLMDKDKGRPASDFRTSQTAFLRSGNDDILLDLDYRTASLVRIPRQHQEHLQVLRYGHTEKYNAHHDFFNPSLYQNDPRTLAMIENGRVNRMATVFWYLSDVAEGGETIFPRWNGAKAPRDTADCTVGLKVKPERGKVIIFYSLTPDGNADDLSLHAACPVGKEGVKWAANKWVWNAPRNYVKA